MNIVYPMQVGPTAANINKLSASGPVNLDIVNLGPVDIYIGGVGVTAATGTPVPAGGTFSTNWSGPCFAYCATLQVSPADTRVTAQTVNEG